MRYELLIKNEWVAHETMNTDQLEDALFFQFSLVRGLRELEKDGKVKFDFSDAEDDHIWVYTNDPKIADDFGFIDLTEDDKEPESFN